MTAIATDPAANAAAVPAALPGRGSESRLRRGGLLHAAAGLAAATTMVGAQAGIVYSGALNQPFNTFFLPVGVDGVLHQTTITVVPGQSMRLNVQTTKGSESLLVDGIGISNSIGPVTTGPSPSLNLALFSAAGGDLIDGSDFFGGAPYVQSATISAGTTAYFGFRFNQGKGGQQLYGWVEFTDSPGSNWAVNGFAYENSGAGIRTGDTGVVAAVPEPGTVPLVAAAGLAAALFRRRRLPMLAIPLLAALATVLPAQASVVSQTASVAGTNLYTMTSNSASFGVNSSAAFAGFDTTLGTLTSVGFAYDYKYALSVTMQGPGGGGGGLNNGLVVNGVPVALAAGSTAPAFMTLTTTADFDVSGTAEPDLLLLPLSTFASAYTFGLYAYGGFSGGGGPGFTLASTLDLLPSSVTVTYTFNDAPVGGTVPEPTSLALVGAAGVTLALQRRRKTVRRSASAATCCAGTARPPRTAHS